MIIKLNYFRFVSFYGQTVYPNSEENLVIILFKYAEILNLLYHTIFMDVKIYQSLVTDQ